MSPVFSTAQSSASILTHPVVFQMMTVTLLCVLGLVWLTRWLQQHPNRLQQLQALGLKLNGLVGLRQPGPITQKISFSCLKPLTPSDLAVSSPTWLEGRRQLRVVTWGEEELLIVSGLDTPPTCLARRSRTQASSQLPTGVL